MNLILKGLSKQAKKVVRDHGNEWYAIPGNGGSLLGNGMIRSLKTQYVMMLTGDFSVRRVY